MRWSLLLLCCLLLRGVWAAESDHARKVRELDEICTKARAEKLKVVHQQKVEECMRNPPPRVDDPRAACERMWNGYGWGVPTGKGGRSPTLYNEIPECLAAFEARKEDIR